MKKERTGFPLPPLPSCSLSPVRYASFLSILNSMMCKPLVQFLRSAQCSLWPPDCPSSESRLDVAPVTQGQSKLAVTAGAQRQHDRGE
jgi:hypothetical protein